jgi:hypothetical protein
MFQPRPFGLPGNIKRDGLVQPRATRLARFEPFAAR